MLQMWLGGIEGLLQVRELAFLGLGMFIGLFFGAIPGLGGAAALALLMPLTYGLEPFTALALSGGVMGGVPMGGSITGTNGIDRSGAGFATRLPAPVSPRLSAEAPP